MSPGFGDDALDERLVRILRVEQHHDVADLRVVQPVGELVDDQPVLILERRDHALALDARDLEAERDDERRVDGGRHQRLEPGDELLAEPRSDCDQSRFFAAGVTATGAGMAGADSMGARCGGSAGMNTAGRNSAGRKT